MLLLFDYVYVFEFQNLPHIVEKLGIIVLKILIIFLFVLIIFEPNIVLLRLETILVEVFHLAAVWQVDIYSLFVSILDYFAVDLTPLVLLGVFLG